MNQRVDKDSLPLDKPRRTPSHPTKSHIVKTRVDGKEEIIRFGEQGAETAGKPKAGESDRMKQKRASFKSRHAKNIAKGKSSPAYWANKVKWADGGHVTGMAGGGGWGQMAAAGPVGGSAKAAADREKAKEIYGQAASSMRAAGVNGIGGRSVAADRSVPMVERTQAGDLGNLVEIYNIQDDSPSVAAVPVATPLAVTPAVSVPSQPTGFLETLKAIPSGIANDLKMGYQAGIFRGRDTQRENLLQAGYNPAQIEDYFARTDATLARNQAEAAARGDRDVQPTNQYDDLARKFAQEYNIVGRNRSQLMPLLESFLRMRGVPDPSGYYENIFNTLSVPMQHGGSVKLEDLVEKYEQGGKARPSLLSGFMQELNRLRALQARQDAQEFRPETIESTTAPTRSLRPQPRTTTTAGVTPTAEMPTGATVAPNGNVYRDAAIELAERYGLPPNVFVSLVKNESAYNPNARSPVGAFGLAQLMPGTARDLGVDPTDWRQNLEGGARYLRQQLDTFGSMPLALAAYNAGPGNVRKHNGIPPFRETRNYVANVMRDAGIPGYAEGGAVRAYDPAAVEARIASVGKGYATGGAVRAYDPAAVDQLVKTIREGAHV